MERHCPVVLRYMVVLMRWKLCIDGKTMMGVSSTICITMSFTPLVAMEVTEVYDFRGVNTKREVRNTNEEHKLTFEMKLT